jgi:hypothetical protein
MVRDRRTWWCVGLAAGALAAAAVRPAAPSVRVGRVAHAPAAFAGPTGRRALDGDWFVRLDRADRGSALGFARGRFEGGRVRLPYVPNARHVAEMDSYDGSIAWYRTTFTVRTAGDYAIRFESVQHRARVWIDGRQVARHMGAYLPFEARHGLGAGPHTLVVRADWRSPQRMRATGWFRSWFNFGGINREVTIRRLGASELDSPGVATRLVRGTPVVSVSVRVRNRAAARVVAVAGRLGGAHLAFPRVRLAPGKSAWVRARVRMPGAHLWSPGRPALHTLRLSVAGESGYVARVGLREIRWRDRRLFLNGHRLRLRGASLQEDVRGRGDALAPADMDALVRRLRTIGANATRAQHALSPPLLERLDAAGILVWQGVGPFDVPGRWAARTAAERRRALRRVRLDVLHARAHPSVLTWNLVNEIAGNGAAAGQREYVIKAARLVRRLDPGRPVALDVWGTHVPARADRLYRSVDAIGATDYEGWYANPFAAAATLRANMTAWLELLHRVFPRKILVVTEFGAEANDRNPSDAPGGMRFQARLLTRHIRAYQADPQLSGMLVWSLQDFALRPNFLGGSVRSQAPGIVLQRGINAKGLFTYGGRPKPAVAAVARAFAAGP